MKYNIEQLVNRCKNGEFSNIAQSGARKCFPIDNDYVLVVGKNGHNIKQQEEKAKIKKSMSELEQIGIKNVYSIIDYLVIGENIYELQRKANGQLFKQSEVKQYTIDSINRTQKNIDSLLSKGKNVEYLKKELEYLNEYMKCDRFKSLIDTRRNELLRRYNIILNMTDEQIRNFFITFFTLADYNIEVDTTGDNILYNEDGFQFIDLEYNPKQSVKIQNILDFDSDIMNLLLGTNYIKEMPNKEICEIIDKTAITLEHIIESILGMKYNQQSIEMEEIKRALQTYKKIGMPVDKMIERLEISKKVGEKEKKEEGR